MSSSNHGHMPPDRGAHRGKGRLGRTIEELGIDAETLQRAALILDDAVVTLQFELEPECLRSSVAQVQSASAALSLSLLGIVARTERVLVLAESDGHENGNEPRGRQAREPHMSTHRQTMREIVRASRRENSDVLLELREFECAMAEILKNLEGHHGELRELHVRIGELASMVEGASRIEAARALGEQALRASANGEQIVRAFTQVCEALRGWVAEGSSA